MVKTTLILWVLTIVWKAVFGKDYCSVDLKHALCQNNNDISEDCPADVQFYSTSDETKHEIVNTLNLIRSKIVNGDDVRGHGEFFPASNMLQMVWDDELANASSSISKKCNMYTPCSQCNVFERFPVTFMQKMLPFSLYNEPLSPKLYIEFLLREDFDAAKQNSINQFQSYLILPYDQITWAETYMVGCSISVFKKMGKFMHNLVCVLGPSEPKEMKPIYHIGEPCTDCPIGSECSDDSKGLCKCTDNCYPANYLPSASLSYHRQRREATVKPVAGGPANSNDTAVHNTSAVEPVVHAVHTEAAVVEENVEETTHASIEVTTDSSLHGLPLVASNSSETANDASVLISTSPMMVGSILIASALFIR